MNKTCLIVGLGQIGMEYDYGKIKEKSIFTHAHAINKHPNFELIGAVDISEKKRDRFEQLYVTPTFNDIDTALKELKPEIVIIATPTITQSVNSKRLSLIKRI